MARILAHPAYVEPWSMPRMAWVAIFAIAAGLFFLLALSANRAVGQSVTEQITQAETAFCQRFVPSPGAPSAVCLQEVSHLMQREQEIRAIEF